MNRDSSYLIGNKFAAGRGPNSTSFKTGLIPWNKGKHYKAVSLGTTFKKGIRPANTVEVGTITIRTDKNGKKRRWIKVTNNCRGWVIYSQHLWTKTFGPIPEGFMVHHKDGDSLNDLIGNYELVTRAQHIEAHRRELAEAYRKALSK